MQPQSHRDRYTAALLLPKDISLCIIIQLFDAGNAQ